MRDIELEIRAYQHIKQKIHNNKRMVLISYHFPASRLFACKTVGRGQGQISLLILSFYPFRTSCFTVSIEHISTASTNKKQIQTYIMIKIHTKKPTLSITIQINKNLYIILNQSHFILSCPPSSYVPPLYPQDAFSSFLLSLHL